MKILRTPETCFEALTDFAFVPNYTDITDAETGAPLRIAHYEAGPTDGSPILLMHGNPTWSYLYRAMITPLAAAGHRVIAVDLVGCGRSDKPARRDDYSLSRHYAWIASWIEANDLQDITLFCQDWGGTIGLAQVARMPERFARVIASNTGVPAGEGGNDNLRGWLAMMAAAESFPWGVLQSGNAIARDMSPDIMAAYHAPFPEPPYEAGICAFPALIAIFPENPGVAVNLQVWDGLRRFEKPFLTIWGARDTVSSGGDEKLQKNVPGTKGQPHHVLPNAGHFTQEDEPAELVRQILSFVRATSLPRTGHATGGAI